MDGEDSSPTGRPLRSRGLLVLAAPIWGALGALLGALGGQLSGGTLLDPPLNGGLI